MRHFSKMAARAAKIRGGKVDILKEHVKIYKVANFQNFRKTFQAEKLVDALHSVAGKFRKASHQFDKILKSPILKKKSNEGKIRVDLNNKFSEKQFRKSTRHSGTQRSTEDSCIDLFNNQVEVEKQLRKSTRLSGIQSSTEDSCIDLLNNRVSIESSLEESSNECRVSYDSDDLLVYAKKQAANNRCSAPGRLLTSSKCKKLLTSCQKPQKPVPSQPDNPLNTVENGTRRLVTTKSNQTSKDKQPVEGNGKINEKPKSKKRKLLANTLEAANFSQNSDETSLEVVVPCPYTATPSKKAKNSSKKADKHVPPVPVISGWESDDSITRARRESSALFVKKDKKQPPQRSVPTIVCTSLPRSEVEAISSIATKLGKFVVEATVSERTTHVVTPSPRRTINLLKGIARGCWILNVKWVYESLEADKWLHEEKYELLEFSSAVKHARLERQAFGPEFSLDLFTNVGPVYVCRATMPPPADLIELIRLCGGTVVSSARAARLMVGSSQIFSPTPGTPPPLLVKEKWVLDSISRLVSLDPYDYQVIPAET